MLDCCYTNRKDGMSFIPSFWHFKLHSFVGADLRTVRSKRVALCKRTVGDARPYGSEDNYFNPK